MRAATLVSRLPKTLRTLTLAALPLLLASTAQAQPTFDKSFAPNEIGPGGISTLTFTINNASGGSVTDLAFTDALPAAVTISTPRAITNGCGGMVDAPEGGSTITFIEGMVAPGATCQISVDVTASTVGTHMNTSGDLTSSAGNSGPATADLGVLTDRPSFSKAFSPTAVNLGERSTLTFTIDNSANAAVVSNLSFVDNLPTGLEVANPSNLASTCTTPNITAVPGTSLISSPSGTAILASTACTITVDVVATGIGRLENITGNFTGFSIATFMTENSGKAGAVIDVSVDTVALRKGFIDDPVAAGDTVDLEFTLTNFDRFDSATNIAFTDDLDATLSGLVATGLPMSNVCGAGSTLSGTSLLSLTGGTLAPGESCTFTVTLQVPGGAATGAYPNTTGVLTATLGSSPFTGSTASETLFVAPVPTFTKTFLDNPVATGDSTRLEFTITNTSSTSSATDIAFNDPIIFPDGSLVSLPAAGSCGAGSIFFTQVINGTPFFSVSNGTLAPSASCTFEVTFNIPADLPAGPYTNITEPITATVDATSVIGGMATDTLTVVAGPSLRKEFTDDPVAPGGTLTLEFTLEHSEFASTDATNIAFTDDLNAALAGLTAIGLPLTDPCGTGSSLTGTTTLTFSGGTLAPAASCTFSVTLQLPATGTGTFTNTTSTVTSTVAGLAVTSNAATDDFLVTGLSFTKEFINDPLLPTSTNGILRFTLTNLAGAPDATSIFFTDSLSTTLSGLVAGAPLPTTPCGAASVISGTNFLIFVGGEVPGGSSCSFDVPLVVPMSASDGSYPNVTSNLTATIDGSTVVLPIAADNLVIDTNFLQFSKTFTDDPVAPGDTVTLQFSITNSSATNTVTALTFDDDLDAALTGLTATGLPTNPCGAGSTLTGTSTLTLAGGTLAPGATCTFDATLQIPAAAAAGIYTNNTTAVSGVVGAVPVTGNVATDGLQVFNVMFSKVFSGPVQPGNTVDLDFTIENLGTDPVAGLAFTDDLDATLTGLVATTLPTNPCGAGSTVTGTSLLTFNGGSVPGSSSCTFTVTLTAPMAADPGQYLNVTSDLTQSGLSVADPAMASLDVQPAPGTVVFGKSFTTDPVIPGGDVTVEYSIRNTSGVATLTDIAFTDDLDAALTGLAATGLPTNPCGAGSTLTGTSTLTLATGTLAPGATCTFTATLAVPTSASPASYTSTTGTISAVASGVPFDDGTATDDLVVSGLTLAKAFGGVVAEGGTTTLTFTVTNPDTNNAATNVSFTDDLDAALTGLTASNFPTDPCGVGSTVSGASLLALANGTVAAGGNCMFTVDVTVPDPTASGMYTNTTGDLLLDGTVVGSPATADLEVVDPSPGATFTKAFLASPVLPTGTVQVQYTLTNQSATGDLTDLTFTDDLDAALTGLVATGLPSMNDCGTGSTVSGTTAITLADGNLAPSANCTITVTLQVPGSAAAGTYPSTTGNLTGTAFGAPVDSGTASADLVVGGLALTKAFGGDTAAGGVTTLTFTITNTDTNNAAANVSFTDDLDATLTGLVASNFPTDPCGVGSTVSGASLLALANGSLPAGGNCMFSVDVTVPGTAAEGMYTNTTSDLLLGGTVVGTPATADLTVTAAPTGATFTKAFVTNPVLPAGTVQVEYTITNQSPLGDLTAIAFTDDLDAALTGLVATGLPSMDDCGTGSMLSGTSPVTFTGGSLAPSGTCTITATLQVPATAAIGTYPGTTGNLTGTAFGAPIDPVTASADLEIVGLEFTKEFVGVIVPGATPTLEFTITNPDMDNAVTDITFTDDLDAVLTGLVATDLPLADPCGVGSMATGTDVITLTGGTVAAGGSCTFAVTVQIPEDAERGDYVNITSALDFSVNGMGVTGDPAGAANAPLTVGGSILEIPTLGEWAMLLMAFALAMVAIRRLRVG